VTDHTPDIRPGSYVRVPDGATEDEIEDVEQTLADLRRNQQIREEYEEMKRDDGTFPGGAAAAKEDLAEKYHVSVATVRRALFGA
jgi:DNA-binding GntR family transcriptional regulator